MTESAADGARRENFGAKDYLMAEAELLDLLNKANSAQARYRNARKKWKKDGLNLGQFDAIQLLKRQDEADVLDNERDRQRYAAWAGVKLEGEQAAFSFTPMTPEETELRAKNDAMQMGFEAGKRGDARGTNRFADQPGNIAFAAWDEGWINGEKEYFAGATPTPRQPSKGRGAESKGKAKNKNQPPAAAPATEPGETAAGNAGDPPPDSDQVPAPLKAEPEASEQKQDAEPDFPETQGRA